MKCEECSHYKPYKCGKKDGEDNIVMMCELEECDDLERIRAIVTRALKADDPINLYKANCIIEIADILNIGEDDRKGQQVIIEDIL